MSGPDRMMMRRTAGLLALPEFMVPVASEWARNCSPGGVYCPTVHDQGYCHPTKAVGVELLVCLKIDGLINAHLGNDW
jgi:hypothetical protein